MSKGIIINDQANAAYIPAIKAAVSFEQVPKIDPVNPSVVDTNGSNAYASWGADNLFPQQIIEAAYKSTIIPPVLEWKANALYSGGLVYGTVTNNAKTGKEELTVLSDPDINAWMKRTNLSKTLIELCNDYYWFYNVFPQLILSRDRSQIAAIAHTEAAFCRWEKQNPNKKYQVENIYLNANWDTDNSINKAKKIPVLDVYFDAVEKLRARKDGFLYIHPVCRPTVGKVYYQLAAWDTLRQSGWLDVASSIPMFKKNLMKNQLSIKYHIQISYDWWTWKYPDFESMTPDKRKQIRELELNNFNDMMTGETRAGRSVMSTFKVDAHSMKEYAGWKIEAIDDKIKDGIYVEDSQEASSHHYSALGVDPTLLGNAPGKGMGAGSGSDKRVAFNIYVNNCKSDQDLILEPMNFIADYNGWSKKYPGLTFWFRNYWISTLDSGGQTQPKTQASGTF